MANICEKCGKMIKDKWESAHWMEADKNENQYYCGKCYEKVLESQGIYAAE